MTTNPDTSAPISDPEINDESSVIIYPDIAPTNGMKLKVGNHSAVYLRKIIDDVTHFNDPTTVTNLTIRDCLNLEHLDMLADFINLKVLIIYNCPRLITIDPIANLKHLVFLSIAGTGIVHLDALSDLVNLTVVDASGCRELDDIYGLRNAHKLELLIISDTLVSSLACISTLQHLEQIDVANTLVGDLSPLSNMTALTAIDTNGSLVNDIDCIGNITSLVRLALSNIRRIEPIFKLTKLKELYITNAKFKDASAIDRHIDLDTCIIVDVNGDYMAHTDGADRTPDDANDDSFYQAATTSSHSSEPIDPDSDLLIDMMRSDTFGSVTASLNSATVVSGDRS